MSQTRVPIILWLGIMPVWVGLPAHAIISVSTRESIQTTILLAFLLVAISVYMLIGIAMATNWRGMNDDLWRYGLFRSQERSSTSFEVVALASLLVVLVYFATSRLVFQ